MMKTFNSKALALAVCVGSVTLLSACNDSDDNDTTTQQSSTETVTGTAATGKAFEGMVVVKNKEGTASEPVTINADGTFTVNAPKGAPYLIKAYNDTQSLYSYLANAANNVNVTQLTTQAVFAANGQAKLEDLYDQWVKNYAAITEEKINAAAKQVAANLNAQINAAGLNAKEVNIFQDAFKAATGTQAGTGLDKVLDKVKMDYSCNVSSCIVKYEVNGQPYEWNYSIDTTGYNVNVEVTPPAGTPTGNYNLKVTTSVAGQGATVTVNGVPKPANQTEFCVADSVTKQLPDGQFKVNSCSFNGTVGNIDATVSANGFNVNYTIKYEYTPA